MKEVLITVFGLGFYFLPSLISGNKRNATAIFLLNLLLGWTVLGWIVALIWATAKESESTKASAQQEPASPAPAEKQSRINRLKEMRDEGTITQEEFLNLVDKTFGQS